MRHVLLDEALQQKPPQTLYHYTTQAGLLGIISKKEIWLTHTQYLNDHREFLHAVCMVREGISEMLKSGNYNNDDCRRLQDMDEGVKDHGGMNVCVCSFSEDPDSLSQWRAYGSESSGFAIGFGGEFLAASVNSKRFHIAPCIYDPSRQREFVIALIEEVLDENRERARKGETVLLPQGGNLFAYLNRYAPLLKDGAFSPEKEWRIISPPLHVFRPEFSFRPGRSMLTPYYRLTLHDGKTPFKVEEVIVGPTPHPQQAHFSAHMFLVSHGLEGAGVRSSEVPFRNW